MKLRSYFAKYCSDRGAPQAAPFLFSLSLRIVMVPSRISGTIGRAYFSGSHALSRLMKSNYSNAAQLKDLMTAPPMSAAQHAEVMRKRIAQRRMVEEARELKRASSSYDDKR
jgi:hypothetical protein